MLRQPFYVEPTKKQQHIFTVYVLWETMSWMVQSAVYDITVKHFLRQHVWCHKE